MTESDFRVQSIRLLNVNNVLNNKDLNESYKWTLIRDEYFFVCHQIQVNESSFNLTEYFKKNPEMGGYFNILIDINQKLNEVLNQKK